MGLNLYRKYFNHMKEYNDDDGWCIVTQRIRGSPSPTSKKEHSHLQFPPLKI